MANGAQAGNALGQLAGLLFGLNKRSQQPTPPTNTQRDFRFFQGLSPEDQGVFRQFAQARNPLSQLLSQIGLQGSTPPASLPSPATPPASLPPPATPQANLVLVEDEAGNRFLQDQSGKLFNLDGTPAE